MTSNRKAVVVRDSFEIEKKCDVLWAMMTDAEIAPGENGSAVLTLDGKRLNATVLEPKGAVFTVESAEQQPPQKTNKDVKRLLVKVPEASGSVAISVFLAPVWESGAASAPDAK